MFVVSAAAICWSVATAGEVALCGASNTLKASGHHNGLIILEEVVKERTMSAVKVELYSDDVLGDGEMRVGPGKYVNCMPTRIRIWPSQRALPVYGKYIEGISERCEVDCQGPMR